MTAFQVGEVLGKGGSAVVHQALNKQTGEIVALKKLSSTSNAAAIQAEVNLLKELDHRNIVKYLGFYKEGEHSYLVMEFCENGSLAAMIRKYGNIPNDLAKVYTTQVLEGLNFLHEQGVIHRDVKCAAKSNWQISGSLPNSMIPCHPAWRDHHTGVYVAKLGVIFMVFKFDVVAPEVIEMIAVTPACDIWSVGCSIVEMVTGSPPYFDLSPMSALFRIVHDDYPPSPHVDPLLTDFLSECFQKEYSIRISARGLLRHSWLDKATPPARMVPSQKFEDIRLNREKAFGARHADFDDSDWEADFELGEELPLSQFLSVQEKQPLHVLSNPNAVHQDPLATGFSAQLHHLQAHQELDEEDYSDAFEGEPSCVSMVSMPASTTKDTADPFGPDQSFIIEASDSQEDSLKRICAHAIKSVSAGFLMSEPARREVCDYARSRDKSDSILRHLISTLISAISKDQVDVLDLLKQLLLYSSCSDIFCEVGGVHALLLVLETRQSASPMKRPCALALQQCMDTSVQGVHGLLGAGGVPRLIKVIVSDPDPDIVDIVITSIGSITTKAPALYRREVSNQLIAHGAVSALLHITKKRLQARENDGIVACTIQIVVKLSNWAHIEEHEAAVRLQCQALVDALRRVAPAHSTFLLQFLKDASADDRKSQFLVKAGMFDCLAQILKSSIGGPSHKCIEKHTIQIIFNACRARPDRLAHLFGTGIIPYLQSVAISGSHLRQFAIPMLCDLTLSGHSPNQVWDHGLVNTYIRLLSDANWSVPSIEALVVGLRNDPRHCQRMVQDVTFVKRLEDTFVSAPIAVFQKLLEPYAKLIALHDGFHCLVSSKFLAKLQEGLLSQDIIFRINALRLLLQIGVSKPSAIPIDWKPLLGSMSDGDGSVLAREYSRRILALESKDHPFQ